VRSERFADKAVITPCAVIPVAPVKKQYHGRRFLKVERCVNVQFLARFRAVAHRLRQPVAARRRDGIDNAQGRATGQGAGCQGGSQSEIPTRESEHSSGSLPLPGALMDGSNSPSPLAGEGRGEGEVAIF